jgi:hypothetical protein
MSAISDTWNSSETRKINSPDASRTAMAPVTPAASDRARCGSSISIATQGERFVVDATRARAAPSPPATSASRKHTSSACQADGVTTLDRAMSASRKARTAYGTARARAACTTPMR